MALQLKQYQEEALTALSRFFDLARGAKDEAGLDTAFRQALREQEIGPESIPPYLGQGFVNEAGATPYVCLRIPTGGGKTLLGTHALAAAGRHYTGLDRPLALWLVPSNIIRAQTLLALRTPGHPYREALEGYFGVDGLRVLDIADCEQLRPQDFEQKAIIAVGTLQTLRVDDTSGRDVYAYKENFEAHFARAPDLPGFERIGERDLEAQPYLTRADLGKVKRSFANLMYWHRPVVIIDEAHNARTPLTYDTFVRLNPAVLIEMTATPVRQGAHRSNVLYHVSAEELKAEQMIKLPIVLQTHPNWQEAVRDALLTRKRLAAEAVNEADYLRPILLLQAEDKAGEVTVDVLKNYLLEQEQIAAERIAIATGNQRELDGVNLFDPACLVDIVITVEALKEGWDCSFAYVFCSLQKIGSSRDMEQLLGRVLRMPYASSRKSPLLNRAYAHLASPETARVANDLADRLVAMGFEELEAAQAVFPTTLPLFERGAAEALPELPPLELSLPQAPAFAADLLGGLKAGGSPVAGIALVATAAGGVTVTLTEPPTPEMRAALVATFIDKKSREGVEKLLERFELRHQAVVAPSARGVPFAPLPLLCVRDSQGELDLAEKEALLDLAGFSLADESPELPAFVPDRERKPYLLDVAEGHLRIEQEQATYAVNLDLVPTEVSEADLLRWLDGRLRGADTTQAQRLAWLAKVLRWLQREGGYTLTALVRHRNQLCDVLLERLTAIAADARQRGFQLSFLGEEPRGCVSADYLFKFGLGMYPARPPYYQGRYRFLKHYYGMIGDLKEAPPKQPDHEYHCAVALDELPEVRHWVRNLPRFPEFSFWLPTSKDRFYPDFVAELKDGRLLVVEYKGEGYKSNVDSTEKRQIGEYWAKLTGNLFLFAVERDAKGLDVRQQLAGAVGLPTPPTAFAEHQRVRLCRDVASEGYALRRDRVGTVLSIYGGGVAYAVEFADVNGEIAVVTVESDALARDTLQ
jgi:type III restriction enzyme